VTFDLFKVNFILSLAQNQNIKSNQAQTAQASPQIQNIMAPPPPPMQNGNNSASMTPQTNAAKASPSVQQMNGANAPSVNNVCFSTNPCYGNAKCVSKVGMMNDCGGAVNGTSQPKTYISLEEF
jgi:hypothetical protein